YIVSYTGFENDLNFSWELFQERVNNEIVDTLGNFVYRSLLLTYDNYDGVPDGELDDEVRDEIREACDRFEDAVETYNIKEVADAAMSLAGFGNEYIQKNEPWNLVDEDEERAAEVLHNCLRITKAVALLVEPVMPSAAERIWDELDEEGDVHSASLDRATDSVEGGIREPEHLFERIDDEKIDEVDTRLQERVGGDEDDDIDEGGDEDLEPLADTTVSFDDFKEFDIRVARVVEAEPIEDSDDLLRLVVNIGHGERQVVAGLKGLHDPDDLVGERVVVVANLEDAEIFGYESQAMLLAAGDEADLLTTHADSDAGTRVK
ncbi:MAG: class I tRNA ligase family protein, partial [Halobacteria archaeon]|nr:class I tRNA ligase family protein [Halobacteria archaeon]